MKENIQSNTPNLGSLVQVGKLITDKKKVAEIRAATRANQVDVCSGWRILNHCCGTGGLAKQENEGSNYV